MNEELDILKIVADNPRISQRKIAEQTGISLGQVNFLIKKCVKKGLIKIEGQTTKSIRYNITPKGLLEKAELTLEYIKISYIAIIKLTNQIRDIAEHYIREGKAIYLFGSKGEVMEICKLALSDLVEYKILNSAPLKFEMPDDAVILYWESDRIKECDEICDNIRRINILEI